MKCRPIPQPTSVSAEIPLAGQSIVYYRLVATNGSGPATAAGWQGTGFGFEAFDGLIGKPGRGALTQAGAHPYSFKTLIQYNAYNNAEFFGGVPEPVEDAKDITTTLPAGFQGSLAGVDQCTASELAHTERSRPGHAGAVVPQHLADRRHLPEAQPRPKSARSRSTTWSRRPVSPPVSGPRSRAPCSCSTASWFPTTATIAP